jgi:hypothetical protein
LFKTFKLTKRIFNFVQKIIKMKAVDIIKYVIGYTPRSVDNDEVRFDFINKWEIKISYRGMERVFVVDGIFWTGEEPTPEEDLLDFLFQTKDLMMFSEFEKYNECEGCYGSGYVEELSYCGKLAGDCCGSCYEFVECECTNRYYPI